VVVRLTSIGLNHADLMARKGEYRLYSGDPPFTPGLEGGGVVERVGESVDTVRAGDRVVLTPEAPRRTTRSNTSGTYRSHYLLPADKVFPAPANLPDEALGGLWLPFLTAYGCLVWKQQLREGQFVAIPAASSSVGLAAAQVARGCGAIPIGMTTSPSKIDRLRAMPEAPFEHFIATRNPDGSDADWYHEVRRLTHGKGVDVFFDPVAAGFFLDTEIRSVANYGTIWVYGLLGQPGKVDVTPLIRKHAAIRGWVLGEIMDAGLETVHAACREILDRIAAGDYRLPIGGTFPLAEAGHAHEEMERGRHIGKLILVP
jgi:NADPH:quinone reductase-like Zn-dependent oxidoreductase